MHLLNQNLIKKTCLLFLMIACFSGLLINPIQTNGQSIFSNNPKSDSNGDEKLCNTNGELKDDKYCKYYQGYKLAEGTNADVAKQFRNKMLYVVKEQIDNYYDSHKNGRRVKKKWFQTILDVLGISAALAATISNGERAKSVLAASLGSFQAGRNSINKRFQFLQFQILVNKMNANRLEQWLQILENSKKDINEYPWDAARVDLQQYLFRGTFNDALDTLVIETGAEVVIAQDKLNILGIVAPKTTSNLVKNFGGYILPMQTKSNTLDAKITIATAALGAANAATRVAKQAELDSLKKQKTNLLKNYETISLAILAGGDFAAIEKKFKKKFASGSTPRQKFDDVVNKLKNKQQITAQEYDQFLLFVNGMVGDDAAMNTNFLKILDENKL